MAGLVGLGLVLFSGGCMAESANIEVGDVKWQRDLDAAYDLSKESGKPVLILFQEVPGCAGCQKFGREVLSHPRVVEAIESEFVPVLVHNNKPGRDAEILKSFGEPAWNYQVIRFLDSGGKDIIPRKDQVWTVEAVAARMVEALEKADRSVPRYLRALAGKKLAGNLKQAAFAMYCFWTGELKLGGIEGVITTEAGWLAGREVTLVAYDESVLPFQKLLQHAVAVDCADQVFLADQDERALVEKTRLKVGELTADYRKASSSDQKKQISGTMFEKIDLSPMQATKVNVLARSRPEEALKWLSPQQISALENR